MKAMRQAFCTDCAYAVPLAGEQGRLACMVELDYCVACQAASCPYFQGRAQFGDAQSVRESS